MLAPVFWKHCLLFLQYFCHIYGNENLYVLCLKCRGSVSKALNILNGHDGFSLEKIVWDIYNFPPFKIFQIWSNGCFQGGRAFTTWDILKSGKLFSGKIKVALDGVITTGMSSSASFEHPIKKSINKAVNMFTSLFIY